MNIFRSNPTANLQTNIQTKKIPMFSNQSNHYLLKNNFMLIIQSWRKNLFAKFVFENS